MKPNTESNPVRLVQFTLRLEPEVNEKLHAMAYRLSVEENRRINAVDIARRAIDHMLKLGK